MKLNPVAPCLLMSLIVCSSSFSQTSAGGATVSLFTGVMNYEGDLKPNSFTFNQSNFVFSMGLQLPINRWFTWRSGITIGKVEGDDRYNREYLKLRNLSFYSSISEIYTGLSINLFDLSTKKMTPYFYGGIGVFHFNPWTNDRQGKKVYLKPLSTEGQGLNAYPERKEYNLTQIVLPLGFGIKYQISDCIMLGIEFNQRKTFTDYLDDVSNSYIDQDILLNAKGQTAVDLAYRGNELPGGGPYPPPGEIRGTPNEKDWYYFLGVNIDIKLSCLKAILTGGPGADTYQQKCPKF